MMSTSDPVVHDEFFESLLGDFLDESGQLLDALNDNLLQLDDWVRSLGENHQERCDDGLMNEMFRSAHSLKGLSAMLGLTDINQLTHKVENVFDAARKDELIITSSVVELMFQAVDRLVGLVAVLKDPSREPVECESVISQIAALLQSAGAERQQSTQADAERALGPSAPEPTTDTTSEGSSSTDATRTGLESEPSSEEVDLFTGLYNETNVPAKYLSIFVDETELSLDQLTETYLAIEDGGTREDLESLLVISHRIKGSAASVGQNRPAKLAHLMEDLLQEWVEKKWPLTPEVVDAMLRGIDELRQCVENLKRGGNISDQLGQAAEDLLKAREQAAAAGMNAASPGQTPQESGSAAPVNAEKPSGSVEKVSPMPEGLTESWRRQVAATAPPGMTILVGAVRFHPNLPLVGLKGQLLYEKLANAGDLCGFDPNPETLEELDELPGVRFGLATEKPAKNIAGLLRIAGVEHVEVEPLEKEPVVDAKPSAPAAAAAVKSFSTSQPSTASRSETRPADGGSKPTETLRVDIERLDQLMNLAGQLVINKARFSQIGEGLRAALSNKRANQAFDGIMRALNKMTETDRVNTEAELRIRLNELVSQARRIQHDLEPIRREVLALAGAQAAVNELGEAIHQLDRVTDGIQQSVMDTRMVPIGPLFTRFKRVIRDITRTNGKAIRLVIRGEKTELDKRMIDELSDPLIHMVRNSADHGIELPDQRVAASKPAEGTVTLDAFHRGNSIMIQVSDDGRGLNPDSILRKAIERGIVTPADAEKITPHQIYQLIWEPGLSTAEKVTEVSGRGMGMDIVKSKIEALNGTVDLDSTPGKGATLTIKLPLTLAILPSLMVKIDGDVFAMPLESVVEIVSIQRSEAKTVHGQWTARVRNRIISIVRLDEIFQWRQNHSEATEGSRDELTLVIVGEEGHEIGLAVDVVLGEEDVVIKSMAENYRNIPGIAGASILGNGRVSLIIDILAMIDMASRSGAAAMAAI
ncbi:MAG: chemotaxis protein CheA [Pirellulales bacterium]|nr:chemotaxis protein CheA [Pirellulales bacterium]